MLSEHVIREALTRLIAVENSRHDILAEIEPRGEEWLRAEMNDHTLSQVGEWIEALEWVLEANADPESENLLAAFLRRLGGNARADNN